MSINKLTNRIARRAGYQGARPSALNQAEKYATGMERLSQPPHLNKLTKISKLKPNNNQRVQKIKQFF